MIRAEMDRKHLGDQHFQRRQRARIGREAQLPQFGQSCAAPGSPARSRPQAARRRAAARHTPPTPAARAPVPISRTRPDRPAPESRRAARRPPRRRRAGGDAAFPTRGSETRATPAAGQSPRSRRRSPRRCTSAGRESESDCWPTNAPSIARTGQNESSMPSESAISSSPSPPSSTHGSHHAPSG